MPTGARWRVAAPVMRRWCAFVVVLGVGVAGLVGTASAHEGEGAAHALGDALPCPKPTTAEVGVWTYYPCATEDAVVWLNASHTVYGRWGTHVYGVTATDVVGRLVLKIEAGGATEPAYDQVSYRTKRRSDGVEQVWSFSFGGSAVTGGVTDSAMDYYRTTDGTYGADSLRWWWGVTEGVLGTHELPVAVPPAQYACGRTLRDVGGGQWFANVEAVGPLNPPSNEWTTQDVADFSGWEVEWSQQDGPRGQKEHTVALPALSTMPYGGWRAEWVAKRQVSATGGKKAVFDPADHYEVLVDHDRDDLTPGQQWFLPNKHNRTYDKVWQEMDRIRRFEIETGRPFEAEDYYLWAFGGGIRVTTVGGGDWSTGQELETMTSRCVVWLDPSRPDATGPGTSDGKPPGPGETAPPAPTPGESGDPGTGGGDDCGNRSVWSILNPLNIGRTLGCVLRALFIPDDLVWADAFDPLQGKFPFSLFSDVAAVTGAMGTGLTSGRDASLVCGPEMDLRFLGAKMPGADRTTDEEYLRFRLPTPTESGCPAMVGDSRSDFDRDVGDVLGYRVWLKAFGYLALIVAAFHRFMNSAKDRDDLELNL